MERCKVCARICTVADKSQFLEPVKTPGSLWWSVAYNSCNGALTGWAGSRILAVGRDIASSLALACCVSPTFLSICEFPNNLSVVRICHYTFTSKTPLAAPYKFWSIVFYFSFNSKYFPVSLVTFSLTHMLFRTCLISTYWGILKNIFL